MAFCSSILILFVSLTAKAAPTPNLPAKIEKCTELLTVSKLYALSQQRGRANTTELDWNELKGELTAAGLQDDEIQLAQGGYYLAPALKSGLLADALRVALLSMGVRSRDFGTQLGFIQAHGLPASDIEALIERVMLVLRTKSFPRVTIKNMAQIEKAQKVYGLSVENYKTLSEILNSEGPNDNARVRIGILNALMSSNSAFIKQLSSPGFWKMRRSKREAKALVVTESSASGAKLVIPQSKVAKELEHLRSVYGDPSALPINRRYALLEALLSIVNSAQSLSTSDLVILRWLVPLGADWGHKDYDYNSGWLGKRWDKHFESLDRVILATALKKVTTRDLEDVASIQIAYLSAIEASYEWSKFFVTFKRDVYNYINTEFARIAGLELSLVVSP